MQLTLFKRRAAGKMPSLRAPREIYEGELTDGRSDPERVSRRQGQRRDGQLHGADRARHGRSRCAALHPGTSFSRSRGALELQSREVRFVFGGSKWAAAADLQDAHGYVADA